MKRAIIKLHRFWQDSTQTSGNCTILDADNFPLFSALSLERGWKNNKKRISCIPKGLYRVVLEYSPRFDKMLWEIKDVPERSECKFHSANFWNQLNGCISLGLKYKPINQDNYYDVSNSRDTMSAFHKVLEGYDEALLIITTEPTLF